MGRISVFDRDGFQFQLNKWNSYATESLYLIWKNLKFGGLITDLIENEDVERLEALLSEQNLEIKIKQLKMKNGNIKNLRYSSPVRENYWEESCSIVIPHRTIALPAREIAEYLRLYGQPQSFDLFEKENGRCASITFQYGEKWGETQHFTYLREDLLERYLAKIGGELIWVIWGNRRLVSENPDDPYKNFQEVKTYHEIQKISGDS